ncbi:hypothetical protein TspCOW1_04760 [Thiohalobacter sp. COW1]|uniref:class I SAM-dependent methyltransferase n=1 Tax=Thiohalobacter sp. COW1 TaxID=2795687 RepID=UPI001915BA28|nr:class I SAM-dependent methyltransferase [Thiohalobacter sp. COW1]BCO30373.1 hypothetical protein TspCOW1_04760 [Thiohalobacter sp. COW1]
MKSEKTEQADHIRNVYAGRDARGLRDRYAWFNADAVERECSVKASVASILYKAFGPNLEGLRVLDVGCGTGAFLRQLADWGASPETMIGTELLPDRIDTAVRLSPSSVTWHLGNINELDLDLKFDLVSLFTVLSSVVDADERLNLIDEAWQRVDSLGWLLVFDLRVNNPANHDVSRVKITELEHEVVPTSRYVNTLVLAPPLARRVTSLSRTLARILEALPFFRTHFIYIAQKP